MSRFPTQDECDQEDKRQWAAWAIHHLPLGQEGMTMQPHLVEAFCEHFWECGFRHHPELQTRKMQKPFRGQQHTQNASARWVDMDKDDPEPVTLPDVAAMTPHEQQVIIDELKSIGRLKDPPKDLGPTAEVTSLREILEQQNSDDS